MSNYFKDFPIIDYNFQRRGTLIKTVNTTKRFTILHKVLDNITLYHQYLIKEGQRPDIVSDLLYNSVDFDWLILMVNQRFDPYYQWPLFYNEFNQYLEDKYGSVSASTQLVKEYRMITVPYQKLYDGTVINEQSLVIDHDLYLTLPDYERKLVYAYDYEFNLNESRRKIKVLSSAYLSQITNEKSDIFK